MSVININYKGIPMEIVLTRSGKAGFAQAMIWWRENSISSVTILVGIQGFTQELTPIVLSAFLHELGHVEIALLRSNKPGGKLQTKLSSIFPELRFKEEVKAWAFAWAIMNRLQLITAETLLFSVLALLTYRDVKYLLMLREFMRRYRIDILSS